MEQQERLVKILISRGVLNSPDVIRSMKMVPREIFIPEDVRSQAYYDTPLPIGFGQTISAPHMVAMMCEALELEVGSKVLEIGTGRGYHAAVVAEIIAPKDEEEKGHVYTIEIVPRLASIAEENLKKANYGKRVTVISGDGSLGYAEQSPYDRIQVTAAAPQIPKALISQLKVGGVLVIPVGGLSFFQKLIKVRKSSKTALSTEDLGSVAFVPLTGMGGWAT